MADYIYKPKAHQYDFLMLENRVDTLNDSLANCKFYTGSKAGGSSITIKRTDGTVRGFVILTSSNASNCGMVALAMSSSTANGKAMIAASNITITENSSAGTVTIAWATSTTAYTAIIINGEATIS